MTPVLGMHLMVFLAKYIRKFNPNATFAPKKLIYFQQHYLPSAAS